MRCAYFGCMHPIFDPKETGTRKYCSRECCLKARNRSQKRREWNKNHFGIMSDEEKKRLKRLQYQSNYRSGKLPKWMYD